MSIYSHQCHFCGEWVNDGVSNTTGERHWLSDCRPDLAPHDPGPLCTWHGLTTGLHTQPGDDYDCYAYQDRDTMEWTEAHDNFYPDGPM